MARHSADDRPPLLRKSPGEEQFRAFVESVRDYALLILDTDGRIASWNAGAEAIKGYKAGEIIGQHFSKFYPAESIDSGLPQRELEGAIRDGRKPGTRVFSIKGGVCNVPTLIIYDASRQ